MKCWLRLLLFVSEERFYTGPVIEHLKKEVCEGYFYSYLCHCDPCTFGSLVGKEISVAKETAAKNFEYPLTESVVFTTLCIYVLEKRCLSLSFGTLCTSG